MEGKRTEWRKGECKTMFKGEEWECERESKVGRKERKLMWRLFSCFCLQSPDIQDKPVRQERASSHLHSRPFHHSHPVPQQQTLHVSVQRISTHLRQVTRYRINSFGTVEPLYNEVLGTMKITLLYQVSHYIRVKKQRNIKSWDQQNYLVIRGFCYIRPRYNKVPLYFSGKWNG